MKKVFYVLVILIYGLSGCKDNKLTNPVIEGSGSISSIEGKFVGWRFGGNYHLELLCTDDRGIWHRSAQLCASSKIDTNGSFILTNFIPAADSLLSSYSGTAGDGYGIKILENTKTNSDTTAKSTIGFINVVEDSTKSALARAQRLNYVNDPAYRFRSINNPGEFITILVYVNKDVAIKGKFKYEQSDEHTLSTTTLNYNLNYKMGWNKAVTQLVSRTIENDGTKTIIKEELSYSNVEPGPAEWYYFIF